MDGDSEVWKKDQIPINDGQIEATQSWYLTDLCRFFQDLMDLKGTHASRDNFFHFSWNPTEDNVTLPRVLNANLFALMVILQIFSQRFSIALDMILYQTMYNVYNSLVRDNLLVAIAPNLTSCKLITTVAHESAETSPPLYNVRLTP